MKVKIKLFALFREMAGTPEVQLSLPAGTTVASLRGTLHSYFPVLKDWAPSIFIAINSDWAAEDRVIRAGDEVALLPPLAGG